jgi:hypothetical protein
MMPDRRRRSPEGSDRRRKESRRSEYDEAPRMRPGATEYLSSSASSSSSYELIDISRSYPPNRSGIRTFFTAPSERRRLRRRRSSRLFKLNNSSSSSVNSDLAYGTGYLKKHKRRGVRSRKGKEIDRENGRYSQKEREREKHSYSDRERVSGSERRGNSNAEILAVGAGLAKLAREQNKLDLKAARNGKKPEVFAVKETTNRNNGGSRGLGASRISHGSDTFDEEDWESASEAESDFSVDPRLAFGEENKGGWGLWGQKKQGPLSRKDSVVDPRLFGPANSLHGIVTEPVGFEDVSWTSSSDFGQRSNSMPIGPNDSVSSSQSSLQKVYPIPTTDPSRFEAARSSVASGLEPYISSRPNPAPLQHPQPITPVSQAIYEPSYTARSESGGILKKTQPSSSRGKSLAEAALVGVASAAVGTAIVSNRKDDRKDRYRDDDIREEDRPRSRDSDKKESKDERRRDKRDNPDRDDRKERRRDKDRQKDSSRYSSDELRREKKREKRRDSGRDDGRDEKREKRREERRSARSDVSGRNDRYDDRRTKSEAAVSTVSNVDPFMFQVDDNAFPTPTTESSHGHRRNESVPTVVTVEREPDFTRKRSSSIKELPSSSKSDFRNEYPWDEREQRHKDSRDRTFHDAEAIYQETEHSTAPIVAAAMGAAVAAVAAESSRTSRSDKRRDERRSGRSDYDDCDRDSKSRGRERERDRDPIQEEADKAYREIVMARKVASQVIRSRSASPDPSVVEKYDGKEEDEIIRIVTPPSMEDHKKKGPYDAPNADFRPDYEIKDPRDLRNFSLPTIDRSNPEAGYLKRDPDAVKPRPLLNLVHPTPSPSPLPEKQAARSETGRSSKSKDRDSSRSETARSEPARSSKSRDRDESSRSESARSSKSKDRDDSIRSETAWSEPVRSSKSKDREEQIRSSASDVVSSPTTKGVTWGENETKHFDVESPSDHKDEFISNSEIKTREGPAESKSPAKPKFGGWGAIAAGIVGAGAGAGAASSSEASKKSTPKENEKKQDKPYEYRGVVVEPESPPRRRSPPSTGPKPASADSSRVPGAFGDDLDFTATVAAGLQDSGFDSNIVIDDPSFRRRSSPPGSNEPGVYRTPYAKTVSDVGAIPSNVSGVSGSSQGFVMGEVASTPRDWRSVSPDRDDSSPKLSKKEQKKRDKAAKRQSGDMATFEESPIPPEAEEPDDYFEPKLSKKEQKKRDKEAKRQSSLAEDITPIAEPSISRDFVEEPESYSEPAKKSKKSKRNSINFDDVEDTSSPDASRDGRKVSVPVDAFDDLRNEEDEWAQPKSKKKSKRDSDRYDSPARSNPSEVSSELERSSSKKSKDKSKRKSVDQYEPDPTEVSLPPSTPSETSRDGDSEDRKSRKSSSRDSGVFGGTESGDSRFVVSSRYDDEPHKSKKKSRSSTKDDFDDTRSVASAPAGDDLEDSKKSKKEKRNSGSFFGIFGSKKSESGARDDSPKGSKDDFDDVKKKKKSKRSSVPDASSLYGDLGATSTNDLSRSVSNGHGSNRYDDDLDSGVRSDGERKKTRSRAESASSKKDSFLGKAGTLGAGVGLAGVAVAIAAQHHQQSKADNAYDEPEHRRSSRSGKKVQMEEELDPEIKRREFRPSIDPQYGDLLPLPPSDPASPNVEPLDNLPDLPDSGPETPEAERLLKEKSRSSMRRSIQDAPMKSPSHSAVPLKFIMGNRPNPSSPGLVRSSPAQSPSTPIQDSTAFSRNRHRPTSSWDSAKEYKPLYLVENNRRSSQVQVAEEETPLPKLPPSQRTSRSSSHLDSDDEAKGLGLGFEKQSSEQHAPTRQLSIDTGLASSEPSAGLLDSQQSTPKAGVPSHDLEERPRSPSGSASKAVAAAGLVSTIGYLASSPTHRTTKENWLDDLPSVQRQPSAVDPMTKDRSSYLLHSSPMSRKDDFGSEERAMDSPLRTKSALADDSLHSIEEREGRDIFGSEGKLQHDTSVEEPSLPQLVREPEQAQVEADPADEFTFTKSKKDKKKDKKKGEGLSRSSTQDDVSLLEATTVDQQVPTPGDVELEEEFSMPKSKKDKKKDKKGRSNSIWEPEEEATSSQQVEESLPETSREIVEGPSTTADAEPSKEFTTMSKKDKKKDKKKGKSAISWEPEQEESKPPLSQEITLPETSRDLNEESVLISDDLQTPKTKKNKKDKRKSGSWQPEEEVTLPEPTSQPKPDLEQESTREIPAADDFESFSTKKSKKGKKGKSTITWEPVPEVQVLESSLRETQPEDTASTSAPQEFEDTQEFVIPGSKKSKKKGKKSESLTPAETFDIGPVGEKFDEPIEKSDTLGQIEDQAFTDKAVEEPEQFVMPGSKKSKKKSKKSQTWEEDPEPSPSQMDTPAPERSLETESFDPTPIAEAPEEFTMSSCKKGKKKSRKSQGFDVEEEARSESVKREEKSAEPEITPEVSSTKATPMDGPTPATPWATAEEFLTSPNSGYFPSAASLHSPEKRQVSEDSQSKGYFPSSMAILPVAVAGAVALAAHHGGKDVSRKDDLHSAATTSETLDFNGPHSERAGIQKPAPDGLATGYDNDQLSLARQLQEEFGSGSKKSKKDKMKRQSLPSTPDPENSRSRIVDEPSDSHPRARSLSIGPSTESAQRKNLYSEDQLELARQLKADFEKGSKKSKKDKKKRGDSLGPSTQDNVFDQGDEEPAIKGVEVQDNPPRSGLEDETPKGDGFAAGYQEDQLSLARQLQAEFGSGSKKSKKDKKRRSTSQPPQEQESRDDDYFGASAQAPVLDAPYSEEPASIPEASPGNETTRDGLAVGYKEEQLELARQLKEEFGSGSKKSKKDKKDKKRQSLGRANTEDDFSSSVPTGEAEGSLQRDAPAAEASEAGPIDPQAAEPEYEFAFVTKKSKKDKKGKKRESLIRSATEDNLPSDAQETNDADAPQPETVQEADPEAAQPAGDFEFTTKKSKKDKKSKKRDSLIRAATDDNLSSDAPAKESDAQDVVSQPDTVLEPSGECSIAEPADEFEFTTKKSKKDKKGKKRESLVQSTPDENLAPEAPAPSASESREPDISQPDPNQEPLPEPEPAEAADEFEFTTKKSKKDKKGKNRESFTPATAADETSPDQFGKEVEALHNARDVPSEETVATPSELHPVEDDWAVPGKKSKKDKKKRQSLAAQDEAEQPGFEAGPASVPTSEESSTAVSPATEPVSEPVDDFGFTSKKSKKDKKKRQSLLRSSTFDETPEQQIEDKDLELASGSQDISGTKDIEPLQSAEQDDGFEFTSKKSKKDKKKRQSMQEPSITEEVSRDLQDPIGIVEQSDSKEVTSKQQDPTLTFEGLTPALDASSRESALDEGTLAQPASEATQEESENLFGDFSFSKNSKKDKKKRKDSSKPDSEEVSGISTPLDPLAETANEPTESSLPKETIQEKPSVVAEILKPTTKVDADGTGVWDAFSAKKSKKDKKKKRNTSQDTSGEPSGISTPFDSVPRSSKERSEPSLPSENVFDKPIIEEPRDLQLDSEAPAAAQDVVEEPGQDEWSSFSSSKRSKKDKKKRKSGLSTPIEIVPETSKPTEEPVVEQEQSTSEKQVNQPTISSSAQDVSAEPEEDEWASIPTRKSKKDKKRQSGLSTPIESIPKTLGPIDEPASATKQVDELPLTSKEPMTPTSTRDNVEEPEQDERSSFSTKKSKKDKKRQSGVSTPVEERHEGTRSIAESASVIAPLAAIAAKEILDEPSKIEESSAPVASQGATQEPDDDEWGSFSTTKSKKDKQKRKSGLSTPVEEVSEQPIETAESSTPAREIFEEPAKLEEPTSTASREMAEEPVDEWAPISRKQSKKDKKRKSGLSTPAEELPKETIEAEPSSSAATREVLEEPAKIEDSVAPATSQVTEEPADEWGSFSTKKSKKDKKRKSGLSTPAKELQEQTVASEEPRDLDINSTALQPSDDFESRSLETSEKGKDKVIAEPAEPVSGAAYAQEIVEEPFKVEESPLPASSQDIVQEPEDEWGSFSTKKSKKDKKKRKSGLSIPIEETLGGTEPKKPLESERSVEQPSVELIGVKTRDDFAQSATENLDEKDREAEDDGFGFVTKKSKKDKKGKRGSRADSDEAANILQKGSSIPTETSHEPGPSTALEHLVANPVDIEQGSPSLTDKFRDAPTSSSSPSSEHLRSEETDAFPSDLSRKSSKKDKRKRQATVDASMPDYVGPAKAPLTSWADEVEEAEVERKLPVIEDIAKDESLSHIALTTEASPVDDFARPTKKGKKGKKRNSGSIGSSSMAESFRPPIRDDAPKEQSDKHTSIPGLAAAGAALAGAALLSKSDEKQSEPSTSASGSSTPARKLSKKEKHKMSIDRRTPRDDMFDDPALWEGADPKEFEESKGQENDDVDDGFWSPPREEEPHADPVSSHEPIETSREPVHPHDEQASRGPPTPPTRSAWDVEQPASTPLGLTDIPPPSHQNISSTPSESIDPSHDRGVSFEEQPIERTPSRRSRYNTGFSDLPVVREESPVRYESDHHHGRSHHEDDANRDSAFVTESPIPPQGAFTDVHNEHVRDSGVHMRDISPPKEVRAPVPSSDDAIASLAWPQVDEEAETVDINKSLRPKVVADKRRHEESSRSSHNSHRPREDRDTDFFRAQRLADERVDKHHHEERSSLDLLPTQRIKEEKPSTDLHRTRTIHRSAEERPKHHDEEFTSRDVHPSYQEEEQHTNLHRTRMIHESAEERPKHHERDVHPSHGEEHTDLHRTKTIHGSRHPNEDSRVKQRVQRLESPDPRSAKPKEESSVKQRVQRIESPDFHRSSKPKEDKYAELSQSQIPKAERSKLSNETAIAAGTAAIGVAGLGFAAARQLSAEKRPDSAQSQKSASNINRLRTPDPKFRSESANSHRSGTPPLRRSDRKISGDLRSLSQRSQLDLAKEAELAALSSSTVNTVNTANPTANEGRVRAKDMADVYVT